MKKGILQLLFVFLVMCASHAQAPRYVLLEHFTNTLCGVCNFTNPIFYQNIDINNNSKLHHISIHSKIPYDDCVFYTANRIPQDARADLYSIPGTPQVALNGANTTSAANISASIIDAAYCATCSPLAFRVTESSSGGSNRTANIKVRSVGLPPTGNIKLYAAVVEKKVTYPAPNGEAEHHNVFRSFLSATTGDAITLANQGSETTVNFNYTIDASWVASEVYVVTWLQNETTREVLNSGTKFDVASLPVELTAWTGKAVGAETQLKWTTSSESNTNHFDIERSENGKTFTSIGIEKAAGESKTTIHYSFSDKKPSATTPQYYRLKTVDSDGSYAFSSILTIEKKGNEKLDFAFFPNPTKGVLNYNIQGPNPAEESLEITLFDVLGRIVLNQKLKENVVNISINHLTRGTYIAQLKTTNAQFYNKIILE